jgi:hypothetical protein
MGRPIPKFSGKIIKGDLVIDNQQRFKLHCCSFKEGSSVEVIIKRPDKTRSRNQNDYYWKVVIGLINEDTGEDPNKIHEFLKFKFIMRTAFGDNPYVGSTTDLTTVEYEEYLEQCRRWAMEYRGIYIPLPNEVDFENVFVKKNRR